MKNGLFANNPAALQRLQALRMQPDRVETTPPPGIMAPPERQPAGAHSPSGPGMQPFSGDTGWSASHQQLHAQAGIPMSTSTYPDDPAAAWGSAIPGMDDPVDGDHHATPSEEEQALYDKFVFNAIKILSHMQVTATLMSRMQDENPIQALAESTYMVAERILADANMRGLPIPGEIAMQGCLEILSELASLAAQVGVVKLTTQQQEMAFYKTLEIAGTHMARQGKFKPEQVQADYSRLQEMARTGRLDQAMGRKPSQQNTKTPPHQGYNAPGGPQEPFGSDSNAMNSPMAPMQPETNNPGNGQLPSANNRQARIDDWENRIKPNLVSELKKHLSLGQNMRGVPQGGTIQPWQM
ncbi:MAG: hypothetical protein HQL63_02440 [Magnetococcales bacterium]|nr:hypothetical protein [Magnetococcales bacterium]MBF0321393.1 hypothetical protein [Magnetococcales bacterium]